MDKLMKQYGPLLQKRLSERRYRHSLAVMKQAVFLAKRYGAQMHAAAMAGLLHDICKDEPQRKLLQFLENSDIILSAEEVISPQLWHAIAGSEYCRSVLGITDLDVLAAIRYHTTARAGMSLLEQVVYLADLTSNDRDYPDVAVMRRLAETDIPQAMRYAMDYIIGDLLHRGAPLHPDTVGCYNELVLLSAAIDREGE